MNKQPQQGYVPTHEEERLTIKHQLYPSVLLNLLQNTNIQEDSPDHMLTFVEEIVDGLATKMQQNLQLISVEQKKPRLLVN